jgi:antitoxin YefM
MRVLTFSDFRKNMATILNEVSSNREIVVITRSKAEPSVVMSLGDYNSMNENLRLFSTKDNVKDLIEALEKAHPLDIKTAS